MQRCIRAASITIVLTQCPRRRPTAMDAITPVELDAQLNLGEVAATSLSANSAHLHDLESEAIYIIRGAVAESENPVMLYSIGKDSSVLVHLAL